MVSEPFQESKRCYQNMECNLKWKCTATVLMKNFQTSLKRR